MHLDTVEADVNSSARRAPVILDCALDVRDRQLDGRVVGVARGHGLPDRRVRVALVRRVPGNSGWGDGVGARHLGDGDTAGVPELGIDVTAFFVDGVHDAFPAGDLLRGEEPGDAGHAIALE